MRPPPSHYQPAWPHRPSWRRGRPRPSMALDVLRPACPPVVIKALHSDYWEIGLQEARLLRYLNACDPLDASHVVRLLATFSFGGHACLVLEQLHDSLLEVICRRTRSREFIVNPVHNIRKVAVQLLGALALLQRAGLVHGDIKPENILLKKCWREGTGHNRSCSCSLPPIEGTMLRPYLDGHHANGDVLHGDGKLVGNKGVGLKLADFGNSFGVESAQQYYGHVDIQSLSYRAPEVCFGLPFDQSIDMWSVGCIIAELALGRLLFACSSTAQLLQQMNAALGGPPPAEPFRKGVFYNKLIQEAGLAGGEKPSLLSQDWRRESAYVNFSRPGYAPHISELKWVALVVRQQSFDSVDLCLPSAVKNINGDCKTPDMSCGFQQSDDLKGPLISRHSPRLGLQRKGIANLSLPWVTPKSPSNSSRERYTVC
eukprot:SM000177S03201  [mRNA]  locus=s177:285545:288865:- [translate_table: standard]